MFCGSGNQLNRYTHETVLALQSSRQDVCRAQEAADLTRFRLRTKAFGRCERQDTDL